MDKNITQRIITVAAAAGPKHERFSVLQDGKMLYIYNRELVLLIMQALGFLYKIVIPSDRKYGSRLPDGNWTGIIGMVSRSEADLSVGKISLFEERTEVVNFSDPFFIIRVTFITDKLKPVSTNTALLYPFSRQLWILLGFMVIACSFFLFILMNKKQTFLSIFFKMLGSLLEKSVETKFQKTRIRVFLGAWLVFTFSIINGYKALLLSVLSFPLLTGIRDISDLGKAAKENSVDCITYRGHMLANIFLKSDSESERHIGRCLKENEINFGDPENTFLKSPDRIVYFSEDVLPNIYNRMYFVSDDSFFNVLYAFPISKNFCCRNKLNEILHRLLATGIIGKYFDDERFLESSRFSKFASNETAINKQLTLHDLKGAFLVLVSGYTLAFVVFVAEIAPKILYAC